MLDRGGFEQGDRPIPAKFNKILELMLSKLPYEVVDAVVLGVAETVPRELEVPGRALLGLGGW